MMFYVQYFFFKFENLKVHKYKKEGHVTKNVLLKVSKEFNGALTIISSTQKKVTIILNYSCKFQKSKMHGNV